MELDYSPERLGFSSKRLENVSNTLQNYVTSHKVAGINALIARHGKIAYFKSFG